MQYTREETMASNAATAEKLGSLDPRMQKEGLDAVSDFTRSRLREDSFYDKIIPPVPITNDRLQRSVQTDKPLVVVDREPDSPAAASFPFGKFPSGFFIRGTRYEVPFARIATTRFMADVDTLRTWEMDIRQVISDNSIRDLLAEQDGKFIRGINAVLVSANFIIPQSGVAQWQTIRGQITRESIADGLKILRNTPSNLSTHCVLLNHVTMIDFLKWDRLEVGGDMSQDWLKNGVTDVKDLYGVKWISTIKKGLVPTSTLYHFADPSFMGKNFVMADTAMYVERKGPMIDFFSYKTLGGALGNTSSVARADYVR